MVHIGPLGENLIFLISQPRAGSTLLQMVLAQHPEVATANEPWLMLYPVYALHYAGLTAPYDFAKGREALDGFLKLFPDGEQGYLRGVRALGTTLYEAACRRLGKSHFLDKTPRYYLIISELMECFPEAKFIFLIRNPLAVLSSILETWVKGTWILLARDHRSDLLAAPKLLWDGIEKFSDRLMVIHYEQLVSRPEQMVEQICSYLGLEFSLEMLEYNPNAIQDGRMGDPTGIQKYRRPHSDHIDRWLRLGETSQTRHLAFRYLDVLGDDLISALGYDADELRNSLQNVPVLKKGIVVRWERIFPARLTFGQQLYLLLMELIQQRSFIPTIKRIGKLILGDL